MNSYLAESDFELFGQDEYACLKALESVADDFLGKVEPSQDSLTRHENLSPDGRYFSVARVAVLSETGDPISTIVVNTLTPDLLVEAKEEAESTDIIHMVHGTVFTIAGDMGLQSVNASHSPGLVTVNHRCEIVLITDGEPVDIVSDGQRAFASDHIRLLDILAERQ